MSNIHFINFVIYSRWRLFKMYSCCFILDHTRAVFAKSSQELPKLGRRKKESDVDFFRTEVRELSLLV